MEPTLSTKTLGDVVSDTWSIYKDNFWKIIGISAIVQIPAGIFIVVMFLILAGAGISSGIFEEANPAIDFSGPLIAGLVVFFVILLAIFVVMFIVLEGAVTHAVGQQFVGYPMSMSLAFRRTFSRLLPMLGGMAIALLAVLGMAITIIGIPFAIYFGLRWYFLYQVALLEDASPLEALRGSSELVQDNWWRVFGISIVLSLIVSAITFLPSLIPFIGLFIVNIVAMPAYTIAKTVLYGDLRTRLEGAEQFNNDALARGLGLVPAEEEEGWSKFDPA